MAQRKIGFIGVGKMGGLMALRLIATGEELVVFDTSPTAVAVLEQAGAKRAGDVRAVADAAEIVFASLPTPDIVREVALGRGGIVDGSSIKTFVDLSTTGPKVAALVSAGLAEKAIASVDCPVSGGMAGARDGKLTLMVSCASPLFDELNTLLSVLGKPIFVGSKPGAAQIMKLANNLLATVLSPSPPKLLCSA
jgi:3-hydroxyisobutyrate dehydrogenase-like beta-hydroxyacid dehydrogenase